MQRVALIRNMLFEPKVIVNKLLVAYQPAENTLIEVTP